MSETVYIAGPMTWIPKFNFPEFDRAAKILRKMGYRVVSPSELDDPAIRRKALRSKTGAPGTGSHINETWGDFLARDVKLIADGGIDAIVVIDGWEKSKGAKLETFVAKLDNKPIYRLIEHPGEPPLLIPVTKSELRKVHG